jgi:hypothetical protein
MEQTAIAVHIFLEVDRTTRKKLEFNTDRVSGRQIKEKGDVPLDWDLAKRQGERLELVTNDRIIEIRDGEHFVALPPGTIS